MKLEQTNHDIAEYGEKYHFYHNEEHGTIVCTTMYKGQMVRGIAKCDPEDNFNFDVGKRLAYLRCKRKFAYKKLKHAQQAKQNAFVVEVRARHNLYKACEFVMDAEMQLDDALDALDKFEQSLKN